MLSQALHRILLRLPAEPAHRLAVSCLKAAPRLPGCVARLHAATRWDEPSLEVDAFGLRFRGPVGLAAGFDKNAVALPALCALGFSFVEVGGVTERPRRGNPPPRVERLPGRLSLVNWMGLPNDGVEAIARRLEATLGDRGRTRVGLNVAGATPDECLAVIRRCCGLVDYFTVNVSCPNVPVEAQLSDFAAIERLLTAARADSRLCGVPLLLKISPDLTPAEIDALVELAVGCGADGLVATNTSAALAGSRGGLSGAGLRELATGVLRRASAAARGRLVLVGVGGVFSPEDAYEKIRAGATLVQLYTGLVYRGPSIACELHTGLARLLAANGLTCLAGAVGRPPPGLPNQTSPPTVIGSAAFCIGSND